jgi:hypothetical protein
MGNKYRIVLEENDELLIARKETPLVYHYSVDSRGIKCSQVHPIAFNANWENKEEIKAFKQIDLPTSNEEGREVDNNEDDNKEDDLEVYSD